MSSNFLAIFMPTTTELSRSIFLGHDEKKNYGQEERSFNNIVEDHTRIWNDWLRHQYMRPGTSKKMYCEIPINCPELYP